MKKLGFWPLGQGVPFHMVTQSPWPFISAFSGFFFMVGLVNWMHYFSMKMISLGVLLIAMMFFFWCRDLIRESVYQGFHTIVVIGNLRLGFLMFILSEVMFFFSFFWGFFHSSLSSSINTGCQWPPFMIIPLNFMSTPLLNTIILISSGATVTLCHVMIRNKKIFMSSVFLMMTVTLGVIFSLLQLKEYLECPFSMSDSVYGSCFFMMTGFHGGHVLIGSIFLLFQYYRVVKNHFFSFHHFGLDAAIWYWHFVDVVWLFLYSCLYVWGAN
uniref:Cytochrome c oxidase subunit 3 n=1 Tax=Semnoderes armiger TaxID=1415233 RepID=A0A5H2Q981_9BILA|nr:cytochrome c oxidase subunit III [Semnoderes armiger]AYF57121.1 cytochrome c oxidase subunit 3 [Semnoderes armiger]